MSAPFLEDDLLGLIAINRAVSFLDQARGALSSGDYSVAHDILLLVHEQVKTAKACAAAKARSEKK